jgi:glycine/D-amino acid oxidase-like deaminating enzyme
MNTDAVIIGAGVIGSSIALELSRAGHRVVVIDKAGGPGHGSTSASSAVVRFNFSSWGGVACSWESKYLWQHWSDHLQAPADEALTRYVRSGLAMLDVEVAPRHMYLPLFDRAGVPYEEWDACTLAARIPHIDVGKYWPPAGLDDDRFWEDTDQQLGAVYTPDAGYVSDPQLAAQNLAQAAQRHGAQFRMRSTVTAVLRRSERITGVEVNGSEIVSAPIVVNAAGPWSPQLNQLAGVGQDWTVSLRPLRQEVHHVSDRVSAVRDGSVGISIADMDLGTYLRSEVGGGLLVGGTEPDCDPMQWVDDPDEINQHVTKTVYDAQVTRAARRLPTLTVPDRPTGVVGVYDVSDDWTPVYDRTEVSGYYVAIGTSGNQFKNAPLVGKVLAAIITAVEAGADHDRHPVQFSLENTGHVVDLSGFSRRRQRNAASSGTVMG